MNTKSRSGRGAAFNPKNRFELLEYAADPDAELSPENEPPPVRTQFLLDDSQTIIARNHSPDIGFEVSVNPYRGCEHGCAYCFARPFHEYLGFSPGLDFETKIIVKKNAAQLLRAELSKKSWRPQTLVMSGVTDCYQPVERQLQITRSCLAVLAEFRNPVAIITKNHLVTRDADLLGELAKFKAAIVNISITSLNGELAKKLEPRASPPSRRLAAMEELTAAGVPVRVMFAPCIPGLNDHEMIPVLEAAAKAGARDAATVPVRLPYAVAPIFQRWLEENAPLQKEKVLERIRSMRGGKLYDSRWGARMRGEGFFAEQMRAMFQVARRRAGFKDADLSLSSEYFRVPGDQLSLF